MLAALIALAMAPFQTERAAQRAALSGRRQKAVRVPTPTSRRRKVSYTRTDLIHPVGRHRVQPAPYIAAPGCLATMDMRGRRESDGPIKRMPHQAKGFRG
jgi:hypothetical protein